MIHVCYVIWSIFLICHLRKQFPTVKRFLLSRWWMWGWGWGMFPLIVPYIAPTLHLQCSDIFLCVSLLSWMPLHCIALKFIYIAPTYSFHCPFIAMNDSALPGKTLHCPKWFCISPNDYALPRMILHCPKWLSCVKLVECKCLVCSFCQACYLICFPQLHIATFSKITNMSDSVIIHVWYVG